VAEAIPRPQRVILGEDKNDDAHDFDPELCEWQVTAPVAQHPSARSSAIDGRASRHPGYAVRRQKRTCVEEVFGWLKTGRLLCKCAIATGRGTGRGSRCTAARYNLVSMRTLAATA
jgi:hypothetical protein